MVVLQGIGWLLLFIAVLVVAFGGVFWYDGVPVFEQATGEFWFSIHSDSLNLVQVGLERHMGPVGRWIWDPYAIELLLWPVAAALGLVAGVFAVPGLLLVILCRGQPRRLPREGRFR